MNKFQNSNILSILPNRDELQKIVFGEKKKQNTKININEANYLPQSVLCEAFLKKSLEILQEERKTKDFTIGRFRMKVLSLVFENMGYANEFGHQNWNKQEYYQFRSAILKLTTQELTMVGPTLIELLQKDKKEMMSGLQEFKEISDFYPEKIKGQEIGKPDIEKEIQKMDSYHVLVKIIAEFRKLVRLQAINILNSGEDFEEYYPIFMEIIKSSSENDTALLDSFKETFEYLKSSMLYENLYECLEKEFLPNVLRVYLDEGKKMLRRNSTERKINGALYDYNKQEKEKRKRSDRPIYGAFKVYAKRGK